MIDRTNMTIDAYLRQAGIASKVPERSKAFIPLKRAAALPFGDLLQVAQSSEHPQSTDINQGRTISEYLNSCADVSRMPAPFNQAPLHDRVLKDMAQSSFQRDLSRSSFQKHVSRQSKINPETINSRIDRDAESNLDPNIHQSICKAAIKYNLPGELIRSVIQAESNFRPEAISSAGAQGLMQLMPATARELGVEDPFDVEQNIDGGSRYIKQMLDRFNGDLELALAAYNAGPGTVERYSGKVPYPETRNYVQRVLANMNRTDPAIS